MAVGQNIEPIDNTEMLFMFPSFFLLFFVFVEPEPHIAIQTTISDA